MKTFGQRVKELRGEQDWTQSQLAQHSGIAIKTIERIETGAGWNSQTTMLLAETFNISLSQLFAGVSIHPTTRYSR